MTKHLRQNLVLFASLVIAALQSGVLDAGSGIALHIQRGTTSAFLVYFATCLFSWIAVRCIYIIVENVAWKAGLVKRPSLVKAVAA